jgi:hypothetical protein
MSFCADDRVRDLVAQPLRLDNAPAESFNAFPELALSVYRVVSGACTAETATLL